MFLEELFVPNPYLPLPDEEQTYPEEVSDAWTHGAMDMLNAISAKLSEPLDPSLDLRPDLMAMFTLLRSHDRSDAEQVVHMMQEMRPNQMIWALNFIMRSHIKLMESWSEDSASAPDFSVDLAYQEMAREHLKSEDET